MQPNGNILIIYYEATLANLLVEVLTDEGYIAYTVSDCVDGLITMADDLPALILLDSGRSSTHAAELVERMRETILKATPLVVMTTAPREMAPLMLPRAVECLHKPFDLNELLACVARYL